MFGLTSAETFEVLDYLGAPAPPAFEAQAGLPVAGPSVSAAPTGQGGGVAAGGPVVGEGGGRPGALEPSGGPGVMQLVGQGLKLADVASKAMGGEPNLLNPQAVAAGATAADPLLFQAAAGMPSAPFQAPAGVQFITTPAE